MFEASMGAILAMIVLYLFPALLTPAFYALGFGFFSLFSGSVTYYFVTWVGVISQNAFWIATILGCLLGSFAICYLRRFRKNSNHINRIKLIS